MSNFPTRAATPLIKSLLSKIETLRKQDASDDAFLGTEIAFAQEFGISRMTVRTALDDLINQGVIVRRRGKGVFLNSRNTTPRILQFIVPDLQHERCIRYLKGIQSAIENRNYALQIYDANSDYKHAIELMDQLQKTPAAGAIIAAVHHPDFIKKLFALQQQEYPFVVLGNLKNVLQVPVVISRYYESGYQMAEDLIAMGHRRIGHIAKFNSRVNIEINQGLNAALNDNNIALPSIYKIAIPETIDPLSDWTDSIHEITGQLMNLPQPPTAVIYNDDHAALIAADWFREHGYRLPDDISLVGVGDTDSGHYSTPKLSTIQQPAYESGREAVALLEQLIAHPNEEPEQKTLTSSWIRRESVAPCAGK